VTCSNACIVGTITYTTIVRDLHPVTVVGRIEKLGRFNWASIWEKFPGYSGINSKISDLAAAISNKCSRADP
jgi:hypothetical protein